MWSDITGSTISEMMHPQLSVSANRSSAKPTQALHRHEFVAFVYLSRHTSIHLLVDLKVPNGADRDRATVHAFILRAINRPPNMLALSA